MPIVRVSLSYMEEVRRSVRGELVGGGGGEVGPKQIE